MASSAICLDSNQNSVSCSDPSCTYGDCGSSATQVSSGALCLDQNENAVACTDPNCTYGDCSSGTPAPVTPTSAAPASNSSTSTSSILAGIGAAFSAVGGVGSALNPPKTVNGVPMVYSAAAGGYIPATSAGAAVGNLSLSPTLIIVGIVAIGLIALLAMRHG
jgi:hypothetical protein